tara:strand:+ start:72 stop:602 length:531 start_codon:yes stop_codon:yes gene_type:complete
MKLVGEKVILRWPKIQDAEWLFENITKPEIAECLTTHVSSLTAEKKWIRSQASKRLAKKGFTFVVVDKTTKNLAGTCSAKDVDSVNSRCELGYWIAKEYWGEGLAFDFMTLLLKFCFNNLKLNKVWAYTADFNVRSQGLLKKCRFKQVGVMRKHTKFNNKFSNDVYFDLLRSEWNN